MKAHHGFAAAALVVGLLSSCSSSDPASSSDATPDTTVTTTSMDAHMSASPMSRTDRVEAMLATAAFQDVSAAEAAGHASSLESLGCFQDPDSGGMGVHYIDDSLMDATVDIAQPEALVYELDADGAIAGLVAHEYIVPIDAWTSSEPPTLFGIDFHRHPTLPLWVLHAWLWKDNPSGIFEDWNPAVRQCPAGVPIFGAEPDTTTTTS